MNHSGDIRGRYGGNKRNNGKDATPVGEAVSTRVFIELKNAKGDETFPASMTIRTSRCRSPRPFMS